ncbi:hypothetical protein C3L33_01066, partial [Rhododendron williamsianum]
MFPMNDQYPLTSSSSWFLLVDGKEKEIKQSKSSDNRHGAENRGSAAAGGGGTVAELVPPSGRIITPNLKNFTYAELQSATRNFRPEAVVGEGGFGTVFKGWVDRETLAPSKPGVGMPVAIKKSKLESWQGLQEWKLAESLCDGNSVATIAGASIHLLLCNRLPNLKSSGSEGLAVRSAEEEIVVGNRRCIGDSGGLERGESAMVVGSRGLIGGGFLPKL